MANRLTRASSESRSSWEMGPPDSWPMCSTGALRESFVNGAWCLVEFWAPDCLFSRLLAPVRVQLRQTLNRRVRLLCCPLEGVQQNAAVFGADAVPALVLFHGNARVRRWLGAIDVTLLQRQIEAALAEAGS